MQHYKYTAAAIKGRDFEEGDPVIVGDGKSFGARELAGVHNGSRKYCELAGRLDGMAGKEYKIGGKRKLGLYMHPNPQAGKGGGFSLADVGGGVAASLVPGPEFVSPFNKSLRSR